MTNEDLKRFYPDNQLNEPHDFVRRDKNGLIPGIEAVDLTTVENIEQVDKGYKIYYSQGDVTIPIVAGEGVVIDIAEDETSLEFHIDGNNIVEEVEITDVSASAVEGTLTTEQMTTLQLNDANYIMFNHEKYILMDKGHTEGLLGYSHVGVENNVINIKNITITISTRGWILTAKTIE